jgi:hypothetical protein
VKLTEPQEVIVAGGFEVVVEALGLVILAARCVRLGVPSVLVVPVLLRLDAEVELEEFDNRSRKSANQSYTYIRTAHLHVFAKLCWISENPKRIQHRLRFEGSISESTNIRNGNPA